MIEFILMGVFTAMNFIVIKTKFEHKRIADMLFDLLCLFILINIFGGTFSGMITAMVAGFIISVYLWYFPPKFPWGGQFKESFKSIRNKVVSFKKNTKGQYNVLLSKVRRKAKQPRNEQRNAEAVRSL